MDTSLIMILILSVGSIIFTVASCIAWRTWLPVKIMSGVIFVGILMVLWLRQGSMVTGTDSFMGHNVMENGQKVMQESAHIQSGAIVSIVGVFLVLLILGLIIGIIMWSVKRKTWTPVLVLGGIGFTIMIFGVYLGSMSYQEAKYTQSATKEAEASYVPSVVTPAPITKHVITNQSGNVEMRPSRDPRISAKNTPQNIVGDIWADVKSGAVSPRVRPDVFLTQERSVKFLIAQLSDELENLVADSEKQIEFGLAWQPKVNGIKKIENKLTHKNAAQEAIADAQSLFFQELLKKYPDSLVRHMKKGKNPSQFVLIEIDVNVTEDKTVHVHGDNKANPMILSTPKGTITMRAQGHDDKAFNQVSEFRETRWVTGKDVSRGEIFGDYIVVRSKTFASTPKIAKDQLLRDAIGDELQSRLRDWSEKKIKLSDNRYPMMSYRKGKFELTVRNQSYKKACLSLIAPYAYEQATAYINEMDKEKMGDVVVQGVTTNGNTRYRAAALMRKPKLDELAKDLYGIGAGHGNYWQRNLHQLTRKIQDQRHQAAAVASSFDESTWVGRVKYLGKDLGKYAPVALLCGVIAVFYFMLNFMLAGSSRRRVLLGVMFCVLIFLLLGNLGSANIY